MKFIDNKEEKLVDALKCRIQPGDCINIAAENFTKYAYRALKTELQGISSMRLLFNEPTFTK